ncbi:adenylate cyclase [Gammaproteobacteria bacterium]
MREGNLISAISIVSSPMRQKHPKPRIVWREAGLWLLWVHGIVVLVCLLRFWGGLEELELAAYDMLHRFSPQAPQVVATISDQVVLVSVTDKAEQRWGISVPDRILADSLERIESFQPRAIGIDIYRDLPVADREGRLDNGHLAQVLSRNPNIIAVFKFGSIRPPPVLENTDQIGFSDFGADAGGMVRRGFLFLDDGQKYYFSLALRVVMKYLEPEGINLESDPGDPNQVRLGPTRLSPLTATSGGYLHADAGGYQYLMRYYPVGFRHVNLLEIVDGTVDPALFKDKIVLIGVRTDATKDYFYIPPGRWRSGDHRMFGTEVMAHAVVQLLSHARGLPPLRDWPESVEYLWVWLWALIGGAMGYWFHVPLRFLLAVVVTFGFSYLGFFEGYWLPAVHPLLAWMGAMGVLAVYVTRRERQGRGEVMQLFAHRVSPEIAELYWEQRDQLFQNGRLPSQSLTATVLFSDIKGFTTISEHMSASALIDWLNEYMGAMVQIVFDHGGHLDKLIGDAVMAVFGVPFPAEDEAAIAHDARQAVACAVAMGERLTGLNHQWQARGLPSIGIRVGLFTGPLVAGTLGGSAQQEYTVLGDTVNTASRLENFDKAVGADQTCRILVGDTTLAYLEGDFVTEAVGSVQLRGRVTPLQIFLVKGRRIHD